MGNGNTEYSRALTEARPNIPKLKALPLLEDLDRKIIHLQEQHHRALAAAEAATDRMNALEADIEMLEREALEAGQSVDAGRLARLKADAAKDSEQAADAQRRADVAGRLLAGYAAQREDAEAASSAAQLQGMQQHCKPAVDRLAKACKELEAARADLMDRARGCMDATGKRPESLTDEDCRRLLARLAGPGAVTLLDLEIWEPDFMRIPSDISLLAHATNELLTLR